MQARAPGSGEQGATRAQGSSAEVKRRLLAHRPELRPGYQPSPAEPHPVAMLAERERERELRPLDPIWDPWDPMSPQRLLSGQAVKPKALCLCGVSRACKPMATASAQRRAVTPLDDAPGLRRGLKALPVGLR